MGVVDFTTESTEEMNTEARRVAVVGGGITGLSLALKLKRSGKDVVLFEADETCGGKIGTIYKDGFELDLGPITCAETPALQELIASVNLENDIVTASQASSVRYIYSKDKLHRVEPGPVKMMTGSLLSAKGKLAFWKFIFSTRKDEGESAAAFARRRFGEEAYQKLFNPLLNGIYAGDAEKLSARWTLKGMNRRGRRIISLNGGLGKLADGICNALNGSVRMSSAVKSIDKTDNGLRVCVEGGSDVFEKVYLTTPAFVTADLVRDIDHGLHDMLKRVAYADVTQIYCEVVPGENNFQGFGFLVPSQERMSLLGALCVSNVFPQKAHDGRMLFVLFATSRERAIDEFNIILKPALTKVLHTRQWKQAIPQFHVGHEKIIESVTEFEKHNPEISIRGNYISGVAVGDCV